ncbi:MAG: chromate transporter [Treponema sp.]|jgi:chromate transporter|nr:chromate transporter [Treponema sp.]
MLRIYLEFFKIGLFAVGGGLATLPFLFQLADKYEWLSREMVGNFLAIAQSAPGPVGVNMAFQAGFQAGGAAGGFLAAAGLVSPAVVVIALVSKALASIKENRTVAAVFKGLRPAAWGLLTAAGFGAMKLALVNGDAALWRGLVRYKECAVFLTLFILIYKLKGHPIIYIAAGAVAGILLQL